MTSTGLAMLPWFHRDFLAATQGWTLAERGAYFLLLGAQWELGALPGNVTELAAIAGISPREFRVLWKKVGKKFSAGPDGLLNARLEKHRAKSLQLRNLRQQAAQRTNAKRWGSSSAEVIPIAERFADRSLSDSLTVSSPSPSLRMLTKEGSESLRSTEGVFLADGARGKS